MSTSSHHCWSYLIPCIAIKVGEMLDVRPIILGMRLVNRHWNAISYSKQVWQNSHLSVKSKDLILMASTSKSISHLQHMTLAGYIHDSELNMDGFDLAIVLATNCCLQLKDFCLIGNRVNDSHIRPIAKLTSLTTLVISTHRTLCVTFHAVREMLRPLS